MKKILSAILIISFVCHSSNLMSFANDCKVPNIVTSEINFRDTLAGVTWVEKKFEDKNLQIVHYDEIPCLEETLRERIVKNFGAIAIKWSDKITPQLARYAGLKAYDIVQTGKSQEWIKEQLENIKKDLVSERLTEAEKETILRKSIKEGSDNALKDAAIALGASTLFSIGAGLGAATLADKYVNGQNSVGETSAPSLNSNNLPTNNGINQLPSGQASSNSLSVNFGSGKSGNVFVEGAKFVASAVASTIATAVMSHPVIAIGVATTVGVFGASMFIYSGIRNGNISELEKKANDEYLRSIKLYDDVAEKIIKHEWIGNNALIMATTNIPGCDDVRSKFSLIPQLNLPITQRIKDNFADAKCKFIERTSIEPWDVDLKKDCLDIVSTEID